MHIEELAKKAKQASYRLSLASSEQKNSALYELVELLKREREAVFEANRRDVEEAKEAGLSAAMVDRLSLERRLEGICDDIVAVAGLEDPVGRIFEEKVLPNGLCVRKQRVPLGLIGVIYEARPNVTIDVATLCLKSGNGAVLRGGSETLHTNRALIKLIKMALKEVQLPEEAIELVDSSDRSLVEKMLKLHHLIDLIIPRGGQALHSFCRQNSTIPVITGGIGICHLFVDATADLELCLPLIYNSKTQRPTVCNALDTLLIHEQVAAIFLPKLLSTLGKAGVRFCFDEACWALLSSEQRLLGKEAKEADWQTEWLSLVLGVRIVNSIEEAIDHIQRYSSGHSDGILTASKENGDLFIRCIDSACVYVNASTRFTDGSQLGLGAEVAISTQKIHARGPMALEELTSYKWVIEGNYQIRS